MDGASDSKEAKIIRLWCDVDMKYYCMVSVSFVSMS